MSSKRVNATERRLYRNPKGVSNLRPKDICLVDLFKTSEKIYYYKQISPRRKLYS